MNENRKRRSEYNAAFVRAMHVIHGNFDTADGDKCVILTIARGSDIEQLAFPLSDAKVIVTKMLVALATYEDELAQNLLDDHFASLNNGEFVWPAGNE